MAKRSVKVELASPPPRATLAQLAQAARSCTACPLHLLGTQTVFGEGLATAKLVLVGEQPGDQEDLAGRPFVGPAGTLLRQLLVEVGFAEGEFYLTNAVKHFKWEPRGKRRLHQKPSASELTACRPWLDAELKRLKPALVLVLGATAARSVLGPKFRLLAQRGEVHPSPWGPALATYHPSAVLRMPDETARREAREILRADLLQARRFVL